MTIKKIYESETAHIVRKASSERCAYNVHGHSYKYEIMLSNDSNLNNAGMLIDFGDLKGIKYFIDLFDHSMILWEEEEKKIKEFFLTNFNRVLIMRENPTAENMARLLVGYIKGWLENWDLSFDVKVGVWETRTGYAEASDSTGNDIISHFSEELQEDLHQLMLGTWKGVLLNG